MTIRRALLTCIAAALVWAAGLGGSVVTASAEERTYTATLTDGNTMALTLDVEPGTPLTDLKLPESIADFIYSVSDGTETVLAKDLERVDDTDDPNKRADPGQGHGIENAEPRSEKSAPGSGTELKPSADSLDKARKRKARDDGEPDPSNPTYSYALPGPAPIGVPNFFIDRFRIPPFLLPIYQAAGIEYGVRWEVLAAINEIETDYGRNLNVSSAGAVGWMQFLPSSWKTYGVDANDDGEKDPFNPVDAIFAAARYLRAAGAEKDLKRAIFAYNHADWYVDSVLLRAKVIGGFPTDLVGSLTGLTQGRFPVDATATYAGAITGSKRIEEGDDAAQTVTGKAGRRSIRIFADPGSHVIAVHDGLITKMGEDDEHGKYIRLRDVFGNSYTYSGLGTLAATHEVRAENDTDGPSSPEPDAATSAPLFTDPATPATLDLLRPDKPAPSDEVGAEAGPGNGLETEPLTTGATVTAGTTLGEIGKTTDLAPNVEFSIKPAGRGAPRIDPKPILDGWKLLETTAIYRADGKNPFYGPDAAQPTIGQILLMSKPTLSKRVLGDPRIDIYECGRRDIEAGIIDRRVLATLELLAISGFEPTVTSLRCGHSRLTTSGRVSYHSSGNGVDISAINGTPILGHQGPGSITDETVRKLLTLQAAMKPDEIITLAEYSGTDNTYAMADHDDHIHVGFRPLSDPDLAEQLNAALEPGQWNRLMQRLNQIDNPAVPTVASRFAITATKRGSEKSAEHAD